MKLLIDIGNTRIKWCSDNNGDLKTGFAIDYKQSEFIFLSLMPINNLTNWVLIDG
jgi:pantothenate kinase type III